MTSILKVSEIQDPTNSNTAISIDAAGKVTAPNLVMPAGTVVQVVSMTSNLDTTFNTSSYTDTAYTLSITPSSTSSKIFVLWAAEVTILGDTAVWFNLKRAGTQIVEPFVSAGNFGSSNQHGHGYSFNYLDSPATTSATTYLIQLKESGSGSVRLTGEGGTGSLTLMEIAQ